MLFSPVSSARDAALAYLYGRLNYEHVPAPRDTGSVWKLDRMRSLLARIGDPHRQMPVIHVAGTKGKGSTAAMIASILTSAGYRTGLYTSPHLERLEERLIIDRQMASGDELVALVERVRPAVEAIDREVEAAGQRQRGPTFFEIVTALAWLHFATQRVDAAVIEVGLGGRFDSTNVCLPEIAVITTISFDHMQQLGNKLHLIAREKAGIIKPGIPVICGVVPEEPRVVIHEVAAERGCSIRQLGVDFGFEYHPAVSLEVRAGRSWAKVWENVGPRAEGQGPRSEHGNGLASASDDRAATPVVEPDTADVSSLGPRALAPGPSTLDHLELGLLGRHQAANAAVAVATARELVSKGWRIDEAAIRRGLSDVRWPARIELIARRPTVILDVAHNAASAEALLETLDESFHADRRQLVFAVSTDKDVTGMLERLLPRFDQVWFTRYVNNPRGVPPSELQRLAATLGFPETNTAETPAAAWEAARQAAGPDDLVCFTGSVFLAAELRPILAASLA